MYDFIKIFMKGVFMPRVHRSFYDGGVYHIINRSVQKQNIFKDDRDYQKLMELLIDNKDDYQVKLWGYCLMPNHYHLVVKIQNAELFPKYMQKVMSNFATWYNARHQRVGHLWQGRYKSFIVQADLYLYTLMRYVEANPVRALLVEKSINWKYSSVINRIDTPPIEFPASWQKDLDEPINASELKKIRKSIEKQKPYGDERWVENTAKKYGCEQTLNTKGRPRLKNLEQKEKKMAKNICKCGGEIKEFDMLFECAECKAKVWKNSHGREFKEKEVCELLQGKTILLKGLKSQAGSLYDTKAVINKGELQLIFDEETKSTKICDCSCDGEVIKIPKGYKCSSCEKVVWEKFVSRELKLTEIKQLFKGNSLYLKNLKSKKGNIFNAEIFFDGNEIGLEYIP